MIWIHIFWRRGAITHQQKKNKVRMFFPYPFVVGLRPSFSTTEIQVVYGQTWDIFFVSSSHHEKLGHLNPEGVELLQVALHGPWNSGKQRTYIKLGKYKCTNLSYPPEFLENFIHDIYRVIPLNFFEIFLYIVVYKTLKFLQNFLENFMGHLFSMHRLKCGVLLLVESLYACSRGYILILINSMLKG